MLTTSLYGQLPLYPHIVGGELSKCSLPKCHLLNLCQKWDLKWQSFKLQLNSYTISDATWTLLRGQVIPLYHCINSDRSSYAQYRQGSWLIYPAPKEKKPRQGQWIRTEFGNYHTNQQYMLPVLPVSKSIQLAVYTIRFFNLIWQWQGQERIPSLCRYGWLCPSDSYDLFGLPPNKMVIKIHLTIFVKKVCYLLSCRIAPKRKKLTHSIFGYVWEWEVKGMFHLKGLRSEVKDGLKFRLKMKAYIVLFTRK